LSKSTTASPHSFFAVGAAGPFLKAYENQNTNAIKTRTQSQIHQQNQKKKKNQKKDDDEDGNPKKTLRRFGTKRKNSH
jgi:hypothetical protein